MKKREQSDQTKQHLSEALINLLETHPIESISIRMITNTCDVDRQTFYYYFEDIYALVRFAFAQSILPSLKEAHHGASTREVLTHIMTVLDRNKHALRTILDSGGRPLLRSAIFGEARDGIDALVLPELKQHGITGPRATDISIHCQGIIVMMIIDWLQGFDWVKGNTEVPAEELREHMLRVADDYLYGAIVRPADVHMLG